VYCLLAGTLGVVTEVIMKVCCVLSVGRHTGCGDGGDHEGVLCTVCWQAHWVW